MCNVHDKLFPVIKKYCLEEDKKLTKKLLSLYEVGITPDQLGVGEAFCCQTPSAVRHFYYYIKVYCIAFSLTFSKMFIISLSLLYAYCNILNNIPM